MSVNANGVLTSLYPYDPSKAASSIFYVLFAISASIHAFQVYHYKSWRVTVFLPWAGTVYTVAFILRQVSTFNLTNLPLYIASNVLIFCAPPIFAAVNYFILGRTLHYIPYLSPIHPGRVVSTFIGADTIVEVLTATGAARIADSKDPHTVSTGLSLIKASIVLQLVLFLCFVAIQAVFHSRCVRQNVLSPNIRSMLYLLYFSNGLIGIRNIYRVVDVFLGGTGSSAYTETHEVFLYIFDALPMLVNSLMLNLIYPASLLPRSNKIYLSQDGHTVRQGPGWQDQRPFFVTVLDPFDLMGLVTGRDQKTKFWENEQEHPVVMADTVTAAGAKGSQRRFSWIKLRG